MNLFTGVCALVALMIGCLAAISGFGIGSILVPVLSVGCGVKTAVVIATFPHLFGTALRFWTVRTSVDRRIFLSFGGFTAIGSLTGALLHVLFDVFAVSLILALVLVIGGGCGLIGHLKRLGIDRRLSWLSGFVSGLLGGMVGNHGGLRALAMQPFRLDKNAFIATSTAIALVVDFVRLPIYLLADRAELAAYLPLTAMCTIAVLLGTFVGSKITASLPPVVFVKAVSMTILSLGIFKLSDAEITSLKKAEALQHLKALQALAPFF
jgi:uncharacterized membrane protein YfcA